MSVELDTICLVSFLVPFIELIILLSEFYECQKYISVILSVFSIKSKVINDLEKLRELITNPESIQFFMAVDGQKLQPDAHAVISEKFLPEEIRAQTSKG